MKVFVERTVRGFNLDLTGKAVHIKGFDAEGTEFNRVFLVKKVADDCLTLVNCQAVEVIVSNEDFATGDYPEGLTLKVLEAI